MLPIILKEMRLTMNDNHATGIIFNEHLFISCKIKLLNRNPPVFAFLDDFKKWM